MTVNVAQITDEFAVKDKDGLLKVWRRGELVPLEETKKELRNVGAGLAPAQGQPLGLPLQKDRVTKTPGASFYFSPHDELEVDKLRPTAAQFPQSSEAVEDAVKRIMEQCGFTSILPDVRGRIERIVASRLRNIRDVVSMKEVLLRPASAGGAGLSEKQVEQVVKTTEEYRQKLEKGEVGEKEKLPAPPPTSYPASMAGSREPIDDATTKVRDQLPVTRFPEPVQRSVVTRPATISSKKLVADVASPTSLVGPIEELQQLTIAEWRRLGSDTTGRVQKIVERINIIAEDSLVEKARATAAWKASPVYKLYVAIGQECMERGASVEAVVKDREGRGDVALTVDEFKAIADLNKSLAF